ncbi:hypothetical protein V6N13_031635 [Hibiscus sabdariffa]|uniref:F-box domain-containing protein n=2 Tax=Hibiscus sabdariffa TaxID=183260 RepID=A0ABR2CJR4_9ROSI
MAKQVKSVGDFDRINSLPDHILCYILSFTPIEDAVQTSILSRRWRYLFASMPTLDFYRYLKHNHRRNCNNIWGFVDRLLFSPNQPGLECFRLFDDDDDHHSRLYGYISAALRRGVKEIVIYSRNCPVFPTLLLTSRSLVILKLNIKGEIKFPANACLPNLKTLHLTNRVFVDWSSIFRLISSCHVLEDLVLHLSDYHNIRRVLSIHSLSLKRLELSFVGMMFDIPGDLNYVLEINTPSLVYLRCTELIVGGYNFISNMSSLEKAYISFFPFNRVATYTADRVPGATHLSPAICNVQYLSFYIDNAETFFETYLKPGLAFHNLVELEFIFPNEDWKGTWIVEFLCRVPNLKKLILNAGTVPEEGFRVAPEEVPSCVLYHLKVVEITSFEGDKHMFAIIRYLLNHGRVLEKLIVDVYAPCEEEEQIIIDELSSLPRNSKKCQVEIL